MIGCLHLFSDNSYRSLSSRSPVFFVSPLTLMIFTESWCRSPMRSGKSVKVHLRVNFELGESRNRKRETIHTKLKSFQKLDLLNSARQCEKSIHALRSCAKHEAVYKTSGRQRYLLNVLLAPYILGMSEAEGMPVLKIRAMTQHCAVPAW